MNVVKITILSLFFLVLNAHELFALPSFDSTQCKIFPSTQFPKLFFLELKEQKNFCSFSSIQSNTKSYWQEKLYAILKHMSPDIQDQTVVINISENIEPNAFALPADREINLPPQIVVTDSLLELLQNDAEIAFVLAHELAHIRHNHFSPNLPLAILTDAQLKHIALIQQNWEYIADYEAVQQILTAGYNSNSSLCLLKRLSEIESYHKNNQNHSHPAITQRLAALRHILPEQLG